MTIGGLALHFNAKSFGDVVLDVIQIFVHFDIASLHTLKVMFTDKIIFYILK